MNSLDFVGFRRQSERSGRDIEKPRGLGEVQPRFDPTTGVAGGTILQSGHPFAAMSINPLANCPRADAHGLCGGLRRLPARIELYNPLSTARRQPGILVHVHPLLIQDC